MPNNNFLPEISTPEARDPKDPNNKSRRTLGELAASARNAILGYDPNAPRDVERYESGLSQVVGEGSFAKDVDLSTAPNGRIATLSFGEVTDDQQPTVVVVRKYDGDNIQTELIQGVSGDENIRQKSQVAGSSSDRENTNKRYTIGRSPTNDLVVDHNKTVLPQHGTLELFGAKGGLRIVYTTKGGSTSKLDDGFSEIPGDTSRSEHTLREEQVKALFSLNADPEKLTAEYLATDLNTNSPIDGRVSRHLNAPCENDKVDSTDQEYAQDYLNLRMALQGRLNQNNTDRRDISAVLSDLNQFVSDHYAPVDSDDEKRQEQRLAEIEQSYRHRDVNLGLFIRERFGVCRHINLTAAYLIEDLIDSGRMDAQVTYLRAEAATKLDDDLTGHGFNAIRDRQTGQVYIQDASLGFFGTVEQAKSHYGWKYYREFFGNPDSKIDWQREDTADDSTTVEVATSTVEEEKFNKRPLEAAETKKLVDVAKALNDIYSGSLGSAAHLTEIALNSCIRDVWTVANHAIWPSTMQEATLNASLEGNALRTLKSLGYENAYGQINTAWQTSGERGILELVDQAITQSPISLTRDPEASSGLEDAALKTALQAAYGILAFTANHAKISPDVEFNRSGYKIPIGL